MVMQDGDMPWDCDVSFGHYVNYRYPGYWPNCRSLTQNLWVILWTRSHTSTECFTDNEDFVFVNRWADLGNTHLLVKACTLYLIVWLLLSSLKWTM